MSVDLAARCAALKAYARPPSPPRPTGADRGVTASWARAGLRAGMCLGAAFGGLILLFGGLWPATPIGVLVGGVVGAVSGLIVGTMNGVVLRALSSTAVLGSTAPDRRERATLVAAATTGSAGLAFHMLLFGPVPGLAARVLLVYVPATAAALTAGWLSRRLPLGS